MLSLQPAARDKAAFFDRFLRYDIYRQATTIGTLNYDPKRLQAEITIGAAQYNVAPLSDRPDERAYQAMFRVLTGRAKPPANPITLTDAGGTVVALADKMGSRRAISYAEEHFILRRQSLFSRLYHLYPRDSEVSLGSVGQDRVFTRQLKMNLPEKFMPAFQVFLVVVLLTITLENISVPA